MKLKTKKISKGRNFLIFELKIKKEELSLLFLNKVKSCDLLSHGAKEIIVKETITPSVFTTPTITVGELQTLARLLRASNVSHHIITWWTPNWCNGTSWEVGNFPRTVKEFFSE